MRLEWPTDLTVNPLDNSLYVLDNNIVLQISENRRVRIIAGRPIHCQVPGIDHFIVSKVAIHSTLESARAIAVSHSGILYIAETDERKINRIQQVTTNGEISIIAGAPSDCDCKIDPNCDCFSGKEMLVISCLLSVENPWHSCRLAKWRGEGETSNDSFSLESQKCYQQLFVDLICWIQRRESSSWQWRNLGVVLAFPLLIQSLHMI